MSKYFDYLPQEVKQDLGMKKVKKVLGVFFKILEYGYYFGVFHLSCRLKKQKKNTHVPKGYKKTKYA